MFPSMSRCRSFISRASFVLLSTGLSFSVMSPAHAHTATCKRPQTGKVPSWARIGLDDVPHVHGDNNKVVGYVFGGSNGDGEVKVLWVTSTSGTRLTLTSSAGGTSTFPPAAGTKRSFPSLIKADKQCTTIGIHWGNNADRVTAFDLGRR